MAQYTENKDKPFLDFMYLQRITNNKIKIRLKFQSCR